MMRIILQMIAVALPHRTRVLVMYRISGFLLQSFSMKLINETATSTALKLKNTSQGLSFAFVMTQMTKRMKITAAIQQR